MKTLLVLRHAKSSWKDVGVSDHERPLNKRGRRDAPRVGRLLVALKLIPDLTVTSSAVRALSTANEVVAGCGIADPVLVDSRLYLADPETIIDVVQSLGGDAERLLVVGHNPGCAELVGLLTGSSEEFPTAALAQVELSIDDWSELRGSTRGRLEMLWTPKSDGG